MSVLIRGEKMPKSCGECQSTLGLFSSKCPLFKDFPKKFDYDPEIGNKGRYAGCPLVDIPPHGRLIDANVFEEMLNSKGGVELKDVPTVIESEGE